MMTVSCDLGIKQEAVAKEPLDSQGREATLGVKKPDSSSLGQDGDPRWRQWEVHGGRTAL